MVGTASNVRVRDVLVSASECLPVASLFVEEGASESLGGHSWKLNLDLLFKVLNFDGVHLSLTGVVTAAVHVDIHHEGLVASEVCQLVLVKNCLDNEVSVLFKSVRFRDRHGGCVGVGDDRKLSQRDVLVKARVNTAHLSSAKGRCLETLRVVLEVSDVSE